jgi:hypothetical protein
MTMTLECLGYDPKLFDPFQQEAALRDQVVAALSSNAKDIEVQIADALALIQGWYQRAPLFERETLRKRLQGELKYRSAHARALFETLFGSNIESNYTSSLNRMGFSTLMAFDYRAAGMDASRIEVLDKHLLATYRFMILDGYKGYTYARPSDSLLRAAYAKKGIAMPPAYETEGEGLDAEIVHFAAVGSHQTGKLKPVAVFTCEGLLAWRERIGRYISYLNYLLEGDNAKLFPGIVYQVNQNTGELLDVFDVCANSHESLTGFKLGQNAFLT